MVWLLWILDLTTSIRLHQILLQAKLYSLKPLMLVLVQVVMIMRLVEQEDLLTQTLKPTMLVGILKVLMVLMVVLVLVQAKRKVKLQLLLSR